MEILITIDDGSREDLKIAKILEHYNLSGTFFIAPGYERKRINDHEIKKLSQKHEIGGHTLNHRLLTKIENEQEIMDEVSVGKMLLEQVIGKKVTKFAYPRGWHNPRINEIVKQCGFTEAYTMQLGITDIDNWNKMSLPRTAQLFPRAEYRMINLDVYYPIIELFEKAKKEDGYFNLCMHGWEIQQFNYWDLLERIIQYISKNK